ncbi:hypothetical protein L2E82_11293 [Cichorium intybus]|uniref:Uncharacterized protein n=1 Tax=Cichorium intybus TaxID=13427 RepID=A0ACB9GCE9_CICIN|nr:hypothetical protein L2E82_11293 [Cichorium intybus]
MENRSPMDNLSDSELNFLREEGTSLSFNQIPPLGFDFPDLLPLDRPQDDLEVFPLMNPFVDDLTNDNLSMNVPILHSGVDLTNQRFQTDIQNQDQIQPIHDDTIGLASANSESVGGFQYQDHYQLIQSNLESFKNGNSGFMVDFGNQELLPIIGNNESVSDQDHTQLIQNENVSTSIPRTYEIRRKRGSRHALCKESISMHFDKPILEAARELNVGSTQLKQRCRKLSIKSWPRRKIKSLQTLINHTQELDNNPSKADVILGLENEKRAIIEGSSSKITDTTKRLRQAAFKAVYKKRKVQKREEASSGTHTQQQSLPSVSVMSGFNHDFIKITGEENPEDLAGDIARLRLSD